MPPLSEKIDNIPLYFIFLQELPVKSQNTISGPPRAPPPSKMPFLPAGHSSLMVWFMYRHTNID